jgi:protein TonB
MGAFLVMVAGSALVFVAITLMNDHSKPPRKEKRAAVDMMAVEKKKKKKKPQRPKPRPKKQKSVSAPRAPVPKLSSSISSVALGIPELDAHTMLGSADKAVGSESVENLVMNEETVDVIPRPVQRSAPRYPPRARAKGITGHVTLRVLIGKSGKVEKVRVVDASPGGVFDEAAVTAVRTWQFEPALYRGEKVRVWAKQVVRFNLG